MGSIRSAPESEVAAVVRTQAEQDAEIETAEADAWADGYQEGQSDANHASAETFHRILAWLQKRDLCQPADYLEGFTAEDIMEALNEHEENLVADRTPYRPLQSGGQVMPNSVAILAGDLTAVARLLQRRAAHDAVRADERDDLVELLQAAAHLILSQTARVTTLEAFLQRCAEFIEPYVDVVDGAYGEPSPNAAMSLLSDIREVLPEGA